VTNVEILIFCDHFQKRLCWVLSSLLQQESHNLEITVNISGVEHDNGTPSNQDVAKFFCERGLDVCLTLYETKEQVAKPSLCKNDQIQASTADWIMCHSADHVFSPGYFAALENTLLEHHDEDRCLGSGNKTHTDQAATDEHLQNMFDHGPVYIADAFEQALVIKDITYRVRRGAGGHIFFRRLACMTKLDGFYARPEQCKDRHLFNAWMNTRSDPGFKSRMGGVVKVAMPPMRHLNHRRGKEEQRHIEEQR